MKDTTSPSQVQHRKPGITFDPNDLGGMHKLMDTYGDSSVPFPGKNEAGEDIWISIFKCKSIVGIKEKYRQMAQKG